MSKGNSESSDDRESLHPRRLAPQAEQADVSVEGDSNDDDAPRFRWNEAIYKARKAAREFGESLDGLPVVTDSFEDSE